MNEQEWRYIGDITLLQLQTQPLKIGDVQRYYEPDGALRPVHHFTLVRDGITAEINGETVIDAHHRHHPQSRNRISNPASFGFTSHYRKMQERFGDHMYLGVAGENIIIETDELFGEDDVRGGVAFEAATGDTLIIDTIFAIPPCKPFAKYCLQTDDVESEQLLVRESLQFLLNGIRGFCIEPADGEQFQLEVGQRFWIKR
jgi:hypothetical protein